MEEQPRAAEQTVILKGDGRETTVKVRNGVIVLPKGFKVAPHRVGRRGKAPAKTATVNLPGLKE
ncbi:MAG: hypothetical protein NVSMB43_18320 [Pseudarthrobacter sp.]